jgi:5-hydroxyisourate hydrolase-like protein (transthyretin family)
MRTIRTAVAIAAICLAVAATGATAAALNPAAITGTVRTGDTSLPLQTCVFARSTNDLSIAGGGCTDPVTGAFTIEGLAEGAAFYLEASASAGYPTSWYDQAPTFHTAVAVTAPSDVDIVVPAAGTLAGTLRYSDGTPATDVSVIVSIPNELNSLTGATTDAEGRWQITEVHPGDYKIGFFPFADEQWAFGKPSFEQADIVTVQPATTTVVDDTIFLPAFVSGTVTDAVTGAPLADVCAFLFPQDPEDPSAVGCTDASGRWVTNNEVAPGSYTVFFDDVGTTYAAEWYDDAPDANSATVVTVAPGVSVTGIDAALAPGAVLTGRVIDRHTRQPISGICPLAFAGRTATDPILSQAQICSDESGTWSTAALPAGPTTVFLFSPEGTYRSLWAYRSETQSRATVFTLTAGSTTTLRDIRLAPT